MPGCCGSESLQEAIAAVAPDMPLSQPRSFIWQPLPGPVSLRLQQVLNRWVGTPYLRGQRVRGMGVDCVQLIAGVLDDLYRSTHPATIPRLWGDAGVHSERGFAVIHALRRAYPSFVVRDGSIEPGDGVVVRTLPNTHGPRRPGHALIAGIKPGSFLHAASDTGVCWTSLQNLSPFVRVYRFYHKETWA